MWILKKLNEVATKYLISEKGSYSIGRKNCDIILEEDASISRKHCTVFIGKKNNCKFEVNTSTGIWLVDENSKYGTFLKSKNEWIKLSSKEEKNLSDGNIIKFGLLENIWSLEYKPVIACASGFSGEQKKEVQNALMQIDGELRNAWSNDCNLVIVYELTLTVKVVLALINGVPIVGMDYVKKLIECVKNQTELPDFKKYRPEMKESILDSSLVSLDPKDTRKDLFSGQLFIFPTKKQADTLKDVILNAGGKVDILSFSESWDKFGEKNVIMINLPMIKSSISDEIINKFQELATFLKNKYMKRTVPESEIAQAVAYASTEKYCNPNADHFQIKISNKKPDLGVVLVEETQQYSKKNITESCVIPCSSTIESFSKEINQTSTSLRKRNHSPDQLSPKSKVAKTKSNDSNKIVKKKADKISTTNKESVSLNANENITNKKNLTARTSSKARKNTLMTDYFSNKNKTQSEHFSEVQVPSQIEINTSSFWNSPSPINNQNKRRLSPGKDFDDVPEPKKSRQPDQIVCGELETTATKEKKSTSSKNSFEKNISTENALISAREKNSHVQEKNSTLDYIGKDLENSFKSSNNLNNTIYSSSIIASIYLKNDGTLIDPPENLVNAKKFKKQKIYTLTDLVAMEALEKEPELNNWLEPHAFN